MDARRSAGERLDSILGHARATDLVEALAGAAGNDAVAANAIATELLNRLDRARFVGASVAAVLFALTVFVVDGVVTGVWTRLESGPAAIAVVVAAIAVIALAAIARAAIGLRAGRRGTARARRSRPRV